MTDWETRYYEAEASHTEANGMLTAERDKALAHLEVALVSIEIAEKREAAVRAYAELLRFAANEALTAIESDPDIEHGWPNTVALLREALAKNPTENRRFDSGSLAEVPVKTGAGFESLEMARGAKGPDGTSVKASAKSGAGATHSEFETGRDSLAARVRELESHLGVILETARGNATRMAPRGLKPAVDAAWLVRRCENALESPAAEAAREELCHQSGKKSQVPRVTDERADEIKGYVNSRHLLEPRWHDISDCIGALQFDRAELMDTSRHQVNRYTVEEIAAVLTVHWLTEIQCQHDAKTDRSFCWCGSFICEPQPSVGGAVRRWVEHVMAQLPLHREASQSVANSKEKT